MNLSGLKINFLGDSITEGHGTSDMKTKNVAACLERISGATVRNYGVGGTRIAMQRDQEGLDFVTRSMSMDDDADVIIIFGGTNDFGHGMARLGTFGTMDPRTFYGALRTLCENMLNKYPEAEIVFLTPLHRCFENDVYSPLDHFSREGNLERYCEIIKEVANYYALPVLDLYNTSGIQPNVEIMKQRYMPDGLHLNDEGAMKVAKRIYGFLQTL